ncbi:hypothetical protein CCACVL1_28434 [Corchorus capsularis]|uniref:Uncharacterized protein n=1 Tax=Corchorus capsularis TaxID=210143 RepID=A0A1R3G6J0_COCAP|nr:hypothetical protein CCACVL1_28434 [Corchorus capsularis]
MVQRRSNRSRLGPKASIRERIRRMVRSTKYAAMARKADLDDKGCIELLAKGYFHCRGSRLRVGCRKFSSHFLAASAIKAQIIK